MLQGVVTLETIEAVTANRSVLSVDNVAEDILELMEGIMLGLCQSYSEDGKYSSQKLALAINRDFLTVKIEKFHQIFILLIFLLKI